MANPGVPNPGAVPPYAQPPQPPLPPRPPRSMAGAIVLILIGVLFLMGTMGVLNWHGLVVLFGRYWPALLILWGIIKLLEHEQYKRAGLPSRGIGVGGVFLMLFVIMGGSPPAFRASTGETFAIICKSTTTTLTIFLAGSRSITAATSIGMCRRE